jgi:DMSO/TMAO reductase YedYZ molybdopterin-dependent catalytic subunit
MDIGGWGRRRRLRVPSREDFTSPVHDPRVVARVGLFLGIAILTAFVTGLISHLHQNPIAWLPIPPEPAWGYRVSQGLHTAAGIAAIPLLLAKLYAAYPAFFERPVLRGPLHAVERGSVGLLVATSVFQLVTGLLNTFQWYPWDFGFVALHYAVAWVLMGSIVVHVAVKLPTIIAALRRSTGADPGGPRTWVSRAEVEAEQEAAATRRGFLEATALAVLGLTALTVGQGVPALSPLAVLAPRQSGVGPQGLPVNKTAASARVEESAVDPAWRLTVVGPRGTVELSRADLAALPQSEAALAIACVEGWSTTAHWSGVPVRDLVAAVSGADDDAVRVVSLQPRGAYRQSVLPAQYVRHPDTLLALQLNGEDLSLDHGFPARIIAPNRPGVLQTKWVSRLEVIPA